MTLQQQQLQQQLHHQQNNNQHNDETDNTEDSSDRRGSGTRMVNMLPPALQQQNRNQNVTYNFNDSGAQLSYDDYTESNMPEDSTENDSRMSDTSNNDRDDSSCTYNESAYSQEDDDDVDIDDDIEEPGGTGGNNGSSGNGNGNGRRGSSGSLGMRGGLMAAARLYRSARMPHMDSDEDDTAATLQPSPLRPLKQVYDDDPSGHHDYGPHDNGGGPGGSHHFDNVRGGATNPPKLTRRSSELFQIAPAEHVIVVRWRTMLVCLILATGAAVSIATYRLFQPNPMHSYTLWTDTVRDAAAVHVEHFWEEYARLGQVVTAHGQFQQAQLQQQQLLQQQIASNNATNSNATSTTTITNNATTSMPSSSVWPTVTMPTWEVHAGETRAKTGTQWMAWAPIVRHADRTDYEAYTVGAVRDWLPYSRTVVARRQAEAAQREQEERHQNNTTESTPALPPSNDDGNPTNNDNNDNANAEIAIIPYIHQGSFLSAPLAEYYTPYWQLSPPPLIDDDAEVLSLVNYQNELIRGVAAEVLAMMQASSLSATDAAMTPISMVDPDDQNDESRREPRVTVVQPVLGRLEDEGEEKMENRKLQQQQQQQDSLVAVMLGTLTWEAFLTKMLLPVPPALASPSPPSSGPTPQNDGGEEEGEQQQQHDETVFMMRGVLVNTCGDTLTYEIYHNETVYLGPGDLSDENYRSMTVTIPLYPTPTTTTNDEQAADSPERTTTPSTNLTCRYTLRIVPSQEAIAAAHAQHSNRLAVGLTVLVAIIFFIVALFFLVYEGFVQKRNSKVVTAAAKASAIVSSLFPSNIRARLLAEDGGGGRGRRKKPKRGKLTRTRSKKKLKAGGGGDGSDSNKNGDGSKKRSKASKRRRNKKKKKKHQYAMAPKSRLRSFLTTDGTSDEMGPGFDITGDEDDLINSRPIADLFPETTIIMADIAGFTAWSSMREPSQVFQLLETVYHAFDVIARRRRVFKVETVGDCYVAVTGLPDPRNDHAVAMCRFARDCMYRMQALVKKLEIALGPDTGDLAMRMGIHSGPVTAGVLRGERSRFQLFGDTMNTASRMETTGKPDYIQISYETASLLKMAGKYSWCRQREEKVIAKGKGQMQTYWLNLSGEIPDTASECPTVATDQTNGQEITQNLLIRNASSARVSGNLSESDGEANRTASPGTSSNNSDVEMENRSTHRRTIGVANEIDKSTSKMDPETVERVQALAWGKTKRLIEWNVDVLARLLRQIVARRMAVAEQLRQRGPPALKRRNSLSSSLAKLASLKPATPADFNNNNMDDQTAMSSCGAQKTPLDEVKEIITLPRFDGIAENCQIDPEDITLDAAVMEQLHDFVTSVAAMYKDNPFHNFEHASHVTMSVVKLLSRIVAPSDMHEGETLHDHTYGITADPLTQFACVFSALIHDADHCGVPNATLVKENHQIATFYKGKSVAEQNSVDLAWALLMGEGYVDLRATIYRNDSEKRRFRQLVVNSVMATDILDKDLKALRNGRWDKAFNEASSSDGENSGDGGAGGAGVPGESARARVNRKATIVIEHLIQASDVAHTMQHWHIYRKWNERLFREMYKSYANGRADKDPSESWYRGEIGFFDFYIIPLAKKLKDCGVFGVSSDEYLNYAKKNRQEWEARGAEVVSEMKEMVVAHLQAESAQTSVDGLPLPTAPDLLDSDIERSQPNLSDDTSRSMTNDHGGDEPFEDVSAVDSEPEMTAEPEPRRTETEGALSDPELVPEPEMVPEPVEVQQQCEMPLDQQQEQHSILQQQQEQHPILQQQQQQLHVQHHIEQPEIVEPDNSNNNNNNNMLPLTEPELEYKTSWEAMAFT